MFVREKKKEKEKEREKKERTNQPMEVLGLFFFLFFFLDAFTHDDLHRFTFGLECPGSERLKRPRPLSLAGVFFWEPFRFLFFIFYFIPKMQRVPR
jgi:hypothetical protein